MEEDEQLLYTIAAVEASVSKQPHSIAFACGLLGTFLDDV